MTSVGSSTPAQMYVASSSQYFSLDDILASQERIPLTIKQDLPQLGFLDSQSHHQNDPTILSNGTKLELPLWMAKSLKAQGRAKLDLPQRSRQKKMARNSTATPYNLVEEFKRRESAISID